MYIQYMHAYKYTVYAKVPSLVYMQVDVVPYGPQTSFVLLCTREAQVKSRKSWRPSRFHFKALREFSGDLLLRNKRIYFFFVFFCGCFPYLSPSVVGFWR